MKEAVNIFWFRRDLRLHDNAGLYHALKSGLSVVPIFIFDRNILDKLEAKVDARVQFIRDTVQAIQNVMVEKGSSLEVYYDHPESVFKRLLSKYVIGKVFTNLDYEPEARERDDRVQKLLEKAGVSLHAYKDQVIFHAGEVLKDDGKPYTVFTPYSKRWKALLNDFYLRSYPTEKYAHYFYKQAPLAVPSLSSMGFSPSSISIPPLIIEKGTLKKYDQQRDYPAIPGGTSRMGIHLRFGTISIRELAREARALNETYLNELIWREFYQMILWHFPMVGRGRAFKPVYDLIKWRNNEQEFEQWCKGETGYPLVDAGMRELNTTGFMHNRVRMVVASFLAKHLLIDWRWGEAYFAGKLLDYDLAANNGGWQWAAGSGCDAAPYFRVFNPTLQARRFDPGLEYIRHWVPEFGEFGYAAPIVEHEMARKRALAVYSKTLKENRG